MKLKNKFVSAMLLVAPFFLNSCSIDENCVITINGKCISGTYLNYSIFDTSGDKGTRNGHTCTVSGTGDIKCWGTARPLPPEISGYKIGNDQVISPPLGGSIFGPNSVTLDAYGQPFSVATIKNVQSIALGIAHRCVLLNEHENNEVLCWGVGVYGQLGLGILPFYPGYGQVGNIQGSVQPTKVIGLSNVKSITAGKNHTCALLKDGSVKCWGDNSSAQIGNPTIPHNTAEILATQKVPHAFVPTEVTVLSKPAIAIDANGNTTCAVLNDGHVTCWGQVNTNNHVLEIKNVTNAQKVVVGNNNISTASCVITTDKTVQCWGNMGANKVYMLGLQPYTAFDEALTIENLSNVSEVGVGLQHICALTEDGLVKCWGRNSYGATGQPQSETDIFTRNPTVVSGINNAFSLKVGGSHSCAATFDGLKCWGFGETGQLGIPVLKNTSTPEEVTKL